MDATGIEPMTSSLQGKRATNCATCPILNFLSFEVLYKAEIRSADLHNLTITNSRTCLIKPFIVIIFYCQYVSS